MKKLLFFLLVSSFCKAQEFSKLDTLQFSKTVEQLVLDTGKNFKFSGEKTDGVLRTNVMLSYRNNSETDVFNVLYQTSNDAVNRELEIKGTKTFNIRSLSGNFLTLFSIWKINVDTNSDAEQLSKKSFITKQNGNFIWKFQKLKDNFWRIEQSKFNP